MSTIPEFKCIFCKETFQNKEDLQIHFRKHGDPKFKQNVKSKVSNQSETETSNEKPSEDGEMVSCDVCSDVFPTISKAITHKHKVHPDHDAKYFCPWCGKLFTMKHLYNKHLKANHEDTEVCTGNDFHCDPCNVDFYIPSAMLYHNKFFHWQDTDIPSFGQSKKIKMFNQEALHIYCCAFCGEEYNNKVNLHKHMSDDHGDEEPTPDALRCPLCDAIFYHLDAYELHVTYHTTEDMYSEKNDMVDEITEFSLESVPPVIEKVVNNDAESEINALGIENFLQLAMDQPVDEASLEQPRGEEYPKIKGKKHKKHKKSKKSAITLDEFLNMNKDVFGEGIDFQGVEEVPSQVVAKRLKVKKQPQVLHSGTKTSSFKDLEKLKKQGIVVKMKSVKKPHKVGMKVIKNKVGNLFEAEESNKANSVTQAKSSKVSMSNDVLTKLMSQSNNEIKIVKKSTKNNISESSSDQAILTKPQSSNTSVLENEQELSSPEKSIYENIEVKCDDIPSGVSIDADEDKNNEAPCKISQPKMNEDIDDNVHANYYKTDKISNNENAQTVTNSNSSKSDTKSDNNIFNQELHKSCETQENPDKTEKSMSHPLKSLPNVSQDTTMKFVAQSVYNAREQSTPVHANLNNDNNTSKTAHDVIRENSSEFIDENSKISSLKALKHLSHLTVKPVLQTNITKRTEIKENNVCVPTESQNHLEYNDSDEHSETETILTKNSVPNNEKRKTEVIKCLDAMKILNKNITIKSTVQSPELSEQNKPFVDEDEESTNKNLCANVNKNVKNMSQNKISVSTKLQTSERLTSLKTASPMSSPETSKRVPNTSSKINIPQSGKEAKYFSEENTQSQSNADLLKNLTNITAKPIGTPAIKNVHQIKTDKILRQPAHIVKNNPMGNTITKEQTNEEIEIFNIDDSDSDEEQQTYGNPASKSAQCQLNLPSNESIDALKNLSKHITIKNHKYQQVTRHGSNRSSPQHDCINKNYESDDESKPEEKVKQNNLNNVFQQKKNNVFLQNTLKNLSKHITIKSGNSSPCPSNKSQDQNTQDTSEKNIHDDDDCDSDSSTSKVKITELNDDDAPLDDVDNIDDTKVNDNILIQYPDGTFSDGEQDDQFIDIESKLVTNTLKKTNHDIKSVNENTNIETLKNISKSVTVKNLNEKKSQKQELPVTVKATTVLPNNLSKDLSIKPKQNNQEAQDWNDESVNKRNTIIKRPINQLINRNTSNPVSAINKEVTVKTFESKTVIQEITTTVTKTIKTINQTVQQEVQSANQSTSTSAIRSQKVQEVKPYQQLGNKGHGIVVRHASPVCGTKIRSATTPVRPIVGTAVRHSNQLVPARPRSNVIKAVTPRMSLVNKNVSSNLAQSSSTKVPNRNPSSPMKRSVAQETSGPFSCFKKPKESLIPVSDIPVFSGEQDNGSTVHYAAATHVSKTMNVTKNIKGNTVTTQMKSEFSSNSQQLSRLSNVCGLKIVKTSQIKKESNIEHNNDASASKRTTLEAIEKLQKHGVLVKKPRLDEQNNDNNSVYSDKDCDNFQKQETEEDDYTD
ncbi:uncharacterized protein LOC131846887 [Achroia grisella]|uniref:uncharacterized protein LOC131846887 n=1 Tax=Achroia grisella TaxID=688607 RepID=UPI0027D3426F|nr:uncharacterized protein LOC131846887 [Achroia grisella]